MTDHEAGDNYQELRKELISLIGLPRDEQSDTDIVVRVTELMDDRSRLLREATHPRRMEGAEAGVMFLAGCTKNWWASVSVESAEEQVAHAEWSLGFQRRIAAEVRKRSGDNQ